MLETTLEKPAEQSVPLLPTQDDLPSEDNIPMETEQHRLQMELLINTLKPWLKQHGGGYISGNMFVYFSQKQLKNKDFRGPDVFVVLGATNEVRKSWVVWDEGKGPDVVIELLSDQTKENDKGEKKRIYQNQLRVGDYFWFDPENPEDWAGFELRHGHYQPLLPDAQNRLISQQLGLALVRWYGVYEDIEAVWLRWETLKGELLPTAKEAQITAETRAKAEAAARRTAEEEIARLKALLAEKE